jgi:hypothetical protein
MYKALHLKNSLSMRNWKRYHADFNEFVLDTTTKLNIVTNGLLPGEDTNNDTASKSADVQFDGVADDSDNNCEGKDVDDDTGGNCDGKDDDNCEGKDVDDDIDNNCDGKVDDDDTHSNCDDNDDAIDDDNTDRKRNMIDDNNSNKCMSSIRSRDDKIRYYHMCVGYGAHLKRKNGGKTKVGIGGKSTIGCKKRTI